MVAYVDDTASQLLGLIYEGLFKYDKDGKPHTSCVFCGANKEQWGRGEDLETHAYEWIHANHTREGPEFGVSSAA